MSSIWWPRLTPATSLLTASRETFDSTLPPSTSPYSLEKELSYSLLNTSLRQDSTGDKAVFTYLLDHVCYPQSYQWVRSGRTWARWYTASSLLSTVLGVVCPMVWVLFVHAASLTIDRADFWCGDIPLFCLPSSSSAVYLSAADGARLTISCHFASQRTLLAVWWLNLALPNFFLLLLLWRLRALHTEMRTDRDLLYLVMRDAFLSLCSQTSARPEAFCATKYGWPVRWCPPLPTMTIG